MATPEQIQTQKLNIAKKSVQLRQGFEAMMMEKIQRQNRTVLDLTDRIRNGVGFDASGYRAAEEDMGVSVGDTSTTINLYGLDATRLLNSEQSVERADTTPSTASAPAGSSTSAAATAPKSQVGLIGPTLAALAVAGGTLLGAYLTKQPSPLVVDEPNRPDVVITQPEQPVQPSKDWKLGASVSKPDAK